MSATDGKLRKTDVTSKKQQFRIIQSMRNRLNKGLIKLVATELMRLQILKSLLKEQSALIEKKVIQKIG